MGMTLNKFIFLPPKIPISKSDYKYLKTKHGSNIPIRESIIHSQFIIIYSHANADDISSSYDWCLNYLQKHVPISFIVYEYTGYTYDDSYNPSEQYTYNDIIAVYDYVIKDLKFSSDHIILIGKSIGTGPSLFLSEKEKVGGVIVDSGFTSILQIGASLKHIFWFDCYPNLNRIRNLTCHCLIIHSIDDEIIPFSHAIELYENIDSKLAYDPLFIRGSSHNDISYLFPEYFEYIKKFIVERLKVDLK